MAPATVPAARYGAVGLNVSAADLWASLRDAIGPHSLSEGCVDQVYESNQYDATNLRSGHSAHVFTRRSTQGPLCQRTVNAGAAVSPSKVRAWGYLLMHPESKDCTFARNRHAQVVMPEVLR